MLAQVPEKKMRIVRWLLLFGWGTLIFSLFYDPITILLTQPDASWSPFRLVNRVVEVQGKPLDEHPYSMGARIFWTMIIPLVPGFLMIFGHEAWRRICPLGWFSMLPEVFGLQKKKAYFNLKTGKTERRVPAVDPDSWLHRYRWAIPFFMLFLGVSARIVFINSDTTALGVFFLAVLGAAWLMGTFFTGRSWCHFICPLSPIQKIYTLPGGILESRAVDTPGPITQSVCRKPGKEADTNNCTHCVELCPDIDSEKLHWYSLKKRQRRIVYYGYFGLILGFYGYYYLYSGNWDYYFSGIWTHEPDQLQQLWNPGFYFLPSDANLPKIIAAPLSILGSIVASILVWTGLEKLSHRFFARDNSATADEKFHHRMLLFSAFCSINLFYIFGGRPNIALFPEWGQDLADLVFASFSTIWLVKNFSRTRNDYDRTLLANQLKTQIRKLQKKLKKPFLKEPIEEWSPQETIAVSQMIHSLTQSELVEMYESILREDVRKGVPVEEIKENLAPLRAQWNITEEEHEQMLQRYTTDEAGDKHRELESLAAIFLERGYGPKKIESAPDLSALVADVEWSASYESETLKRNLLEVLRDSHWQTKSYTAHVEKLLFFRRCEAALESISDTSKAREITFLKKICRSRIREQSAKLFHLFLWVKEADRINLLVTLTNLVPDEFQQLLEEDTAYNPENRKFWDTMFTGELANQLSNGTDSSFSVYSEKDVSDAIPSVDSLLEMLAQDAEPMVRLVASRLSEKAVDLKVALFQSDPQLSEIAALPPEAREQLMETFFDLSESKFFTNLDPSYLLTLAMTGKVRAYEKGKTLCREGEVADTLFLIQQGETQVYRGHSREPVDTVGPGDTIGEMGVFTGQKRTATVKAATACKVLLIPDSDLKALLLQDAKMGFEFLKTLSARHQNLLEKI